MVCIIKLPDSAYHQAMSLIVGAGAAIRARVGGIRQEQSIAWIRTDGEYVGIIVEDLAQRVRLDSFIG